MRVRRWSQCRELAANFNDFASLGRLVLARRCAAIIAAEPAVAWHLNVNRRSAHTPLGRHACGFAGSARAADHRPERIENYALRSLEGARHTATGLKLLWPAMKRLAFLTLTVFAKSQSGLAAPFRRTGQSVDLNLLGLSRKISNLSRLACPRACVVETIVSRAIVPLLNSVATNRSRGRLIVYCPQLIELAVEPCLSLSSSIVWASCSFSVSFF